MIMLAHSYCSSHSSLRMLQEYGNQLDMMSNSMGTCNMIHICTLSYMSFLVLLFPLDNHLSIGHCTELGNRGIPKNQHTFHLSLPFRPYTSHSFLHSRKPSSEQCIFHKLLCSGLDSI